MGRLIRGLLALLGFFLAFRVLRFLITASESERKGRQYAGAINRTRSRSLVSSSDENEILDLNQASVARLSGLPGVGQGTAKKIIRGRPYKRKIELVQRGILPKDIYDRIKKRLTARTGPFHSGKGRPGT